MKRKRSWSVTRITHPQYPERGAVRVGEFKASGALHVFWWEDGKQRSRSLGVRRADLGATKAAQEKEARRLGAEAIEALAARADAPRAADRSGPLTLAALLARYERDGLLRASPSYRRDALACVRRVVEFIGAEVSVADLRPSHVERYLAYRIKGGHAPAGRRDLVAVSIACNWAEGEGLLKENPMSAKRTREAMRIAHTPSRPFATKEQFEALRRLAADHSAPEFAVLLDLAWHTGHRLGAILGLKWSDVSLTARADAPFGSVTWYAGATKDRKKHEHTLPLNEAAHAALTAWRKQGDRLPTGYVFPSTDDNVRPLDASKARRWLREAIKDAGLPARKQGGWHMFRRGWGTARKHLPLQDVAKGGGWTDTATVTMCYQHATAEETRNAALFVA